jgi:hypothetical protein
MLEVPTVSYLNHLILLTKELFSAVRTENKMSTRNQAPSSSFSSPPSMEEYQKRIQEEDKRLREAALARAKKEEDLIKGLKFSEYKERNNRRFLHIKTPCT